MSVQKISVIIPTMNGAGELSELLNAILHQTRKADEIIIVDSESTDNTIEIAKSFSDVAIIHVKRKDFDHGKTRDMVLRMSKGDIIVFLTQDAIPANKELISRLTAPLSDKSVAVSVGRQIAKSSASIAEKLVRNFNYPAKSSVKSKSDITQMGIKTFFSSNACAAYNREIYIAAGGFEYSIKTNEDMFYAAKVIQNGYKVAYTAEAEVYHSHNFTFLEQYRRNYLQGYEIEKHRQLLGYVKQESEGIKLVKYVSRELLRHGHILEFIKFGFDCCARFMGSRAGKKAFQNE